MNYDEIIAGLDYTEKIKEELRKAFDEFKPDKKQVDKIVEKLKAVYKASTYEAGEAIGVIAAQSISEPATQMTMRTYHVAGGGGAKVTLGLPRLIELVDARRSPATPSMEIYMDKAHNDKESCLKLAREIKETRLKNFISEDYIDLINGVIEAKVDMAELEKIMTFEDLMKILKKGVRNFTAAGEKGVVRFQPKKDANVAALHKAKLKIIETQVAGIQGITQAMVRKRDEEWMITTLGSNLKKIIVMDGVDTSRTTCNDPREIEKTLGIEAARNSIVKEITGTLREQGLEVDVRHILLVADIMTSDGTIRSVGRYGVAGEKGSVLARANFEITVKNLTEAAAGGETDRLDSIIENVMINQVAPIGTGMVELSFKATRKKK